LGGQWGGKEEREKKKEGKEGRGKKDHLLFVLIVIG